MGWIAEKAAHYSPSVMRSSIFVAFETAPLKTTVMRINNANAADMAAQVKPMLSPWGTVSVDQRTNTLIIRDVE